MGARTVLRLEGLIFVGVRIVLNRRRLVALIDGLRRLRLSSWLLLLWRRRLQWWLTLLVLLLLLVETLLLLGAIVVYPALGLVATTTTVGVYCSEWGPILIVLLKVSIRNLLMLKRLLELYIFRRRLWRVLLVWIVVRAGTFLLLVGRRKMGAGPLSSPLRWLWLLCLK